MHHRLVNLAGVIYVTSAVRAAVDDRGLMATPEYNYPSPGSAAAALPFTSAERRRSIALLLAFALFTVASDYPLSQAVSYTVFWPPGGILVALFLTTAGRARRTVAIVAFLMNVLIERYGPGVPADGAVLNAAANISQALFIAWLAGRRLGGELHFSRLVVLQRFALECVLPVVAAMSLMYCRLTQLQPDMHLFWAAWRSAVMQESLGVLAVTPALYLIVMPSDSRLFNRTALEHVVLLGLLALTEIVLFTTASTPTLFVVFPILIGISFRLGPRGAAVAVLMTAVVGLGCAISGASAFEPVSYAGTSSVHADMSSVRLLLQVFILAVVYTVLPAAGAIAGRLSAQEELKSTQAALVDASRVAGRAEVATSVLHNVGNVLTSVNVSATLATDQVKKSSAVGLKRLVALLEQQDLAAFVASERGRNLPAYLAQLSQQLAEEQRLTIEELSTLAKHVAHINEIVAMQQGYAKRVRAVESIDLVELAEQALQMCADGMGTQDIAVIREFAAVEPIVVDKHRVLQILINLLRNARQACVESTSVAKRVTVGIARTTVGIAISVADTGVGIAPENLTRIFNHGFTTRSGGHGFGLHSGAVAAIEIGGSLTVRSEGLGHGATFTLTLPLSPG